MSSSRTIRSARRAGMRLSRAAALLALLGCAALPLEAQYPISQDGRLFDANPQIGAGRYNYTRPVSPLLTGNPYATGNVRYGLSLRSFSPIHDPTAFRAPLGSAALSLFRRDSVSVADRRSALIGGRMLGSPYYDPSRTAPSVGYLQGQYSPGWQRTRTGVPLPALNAAGPGVSLVQPLDLRLDLARPLRSRIIGAPPARRPEASAIFGINRFTSPALQAAGAGQVSLPQPGQLWPAGELPGAPVGNLPETPPQPAELAAPLARPLDFSIPPQATPPPPGSALEKVLAGDATGLLMSRPRGLPAVLTGGAGQAGEQPAGAAPGAAPSGETPAAERGAANAPAVVLEPSLLPGSDVFTDMQFALALRQEPGADWFRDMQRAVRRSDALGPALKQFAALEPDDFAARVIDRPLASFVGRGRSALNDELLKAEALLEIGQYYDAADRYQAAHLIDPLNPLPLIGRGHALLAAGEYLSAAVSLTRGLERFPELSRFKVDLAALMGGGKIIDVRRADLIKRLSQREDAQLRFLLGYLEYHSGNRAGGLKELDQAAAEAAPRSIIQQYPRMLRGGALPPPKLPSALPGEPAGLPSAPGPAAPQGKRPPGR